MDRRNQLGTALVVVAVVLFVVPAFFPVQSMLVHDTRRSTDLGVGSGGDVGETDQRVVAYDDLSDRGQELYEETLERDGEYRVPIGEGAPEFNYLTDEERDRAFENDNVSAFGLVIERPAEDGHLPPADERYFVGREDPEGDGEVNQTRRRELAMRYDAMVTSTEQPPLGATPQLLRLGAALLAVLSLGLGGYFLSSR